jgi:hypothetical protein
VCVCVCERLFDLLGSSKLVRCLFGEVLLELGLLLSSELVLLVRMYVCVYVRGCVCIFVKAAKYGMVCTNIDFIQ